MTCHYSNEVAPSGMRWDENVDFSAEGAVWEGVTGILVKWDEVGIPTLAPLVFPPGATSRIGDWLFKAEHAEWAEKAERN